jgi:hypothetical protein
MYVHRGSVSSPLLCKRRESVSLPALYTDKEKKQCMISFTVHRESVFFPVLYMGKCVTPLYYTQGNRIITCTLQVLYTGKCLTTCSWTWESISLSVLHATKVCFYLYDMYTGDLYNTQRKCTVSFTCAVLCIGKVYHYLYHTQAGPSSLYVHWESVSLRVLYPGRVNDFLFCYCT